jgi:hypothetical protein
MGSRLCHSKANLPGILTQQRQRIWSDMRRVEREQFRHRPEIQNIWRRYYHSAPSLQSPVRQRKKLHGLIWVQVLHNMAEEDAAESLLIRTQEGKISSWTMLKPRFRQNSIDTLEASTPTAGMPAAISCAKNPPPSAPKICIRARGGHKMLSKSPLNSGCIRLGTSKSIQVYSVTHVFCSLVCSNQ